MIMIIRSYFEVKATGEREDKPSVAYKNSGGWDSPKDFVRFAKHRRGFLGEEGGRSRFLVGENGKDRIVDEVSFEEGTR